MTCTVFIATAHAAVATACSTCARKKVLVICSGCGLMTDESEPAPPSVATNAQTDVQACYKDGEMETGATRLRITAGNNETFVKAVPFLLATMTVAAGAIIILAFQRWVDFGIAETSGVDAEAATGISDGWVVVGLAVVILALIGGVIFRSRLAPVLLPVIAIAAVCILAIAGFDTITNWNASGFHPDNPGVLVQAQGDPTFAPYAIAGLAILIAISAAIVRGLQFREDPHLLGSLVASDDEPGSVSETASSED